MAIALLIVAILIGLLMLLTGLDMIKGIWFAPIGILLFILGVAVMLLSAWNLIRLFI